MSRGLAFLVAERFWSGRSVLKVAEDWRTYQGASKAYSEGRATYPTEAVSELIDHLGLQAADPVADLGAGTGIFSEQLHQHGLVVEAIEPVDAMRDEIPQSDRLHAREGRAEQTGLPDESVAAVFAATAWHWFDAKRASTETQRILRPNGGLGLIWTGYDLSVPWVRAIADISTRRRPATSPSAQSKQWRHEFDDLSGWSPLCEAQVRSGWRTTRDGLRKRLHSSSAIARLPQNEQSIAEGELNTILDDQSADDTEPFDVPYLTEIYWTFPTKS